MKFSEHEKEFNKTLIQLENDAKVRVADSINKFVADRRQIPAEHSGDVIMYNNAESLISQLAEYLNLLISNYSQVPLYNTDLGANNFKLLETYNKLALVYNNNNNSADVQQMIATQTMQLLDMINMALNYGQNKIAHLLIEMHQGKYANQGNKVEEMYFTINDIIQTISILESMRRQLEIRSFKIIVPESLNSSYNNIINKMKSPYRQMFERYLTNKKGIVSESQMKQKIDEYQRETGVQLTPMEVEDVLKNDFGQPSQWNFPDVNQFRTAMDVKKLSADVRNMVAPPASAMLGQEMQGKEGNIGKQDNMGNGKNTPDDIGGREYYEEEDEEMKGSGELNRETIKNNLMKLGSSNGYIEEVDKLDDKQLKKLVKYLQKKLSKKMGGAVSLTDGANMTVDVDARPDSYDVEKENSKFLRKQMYKHHMGVMNANKLINSDAPLPYA